MGHEALMAAIANYRDKGKSQRSRSQKGRVISCFGVTDEKSAVVHDNDLTTVEQVTNYCKAGGGCGGCKPRIETIISQVQEKSAKPASPQPRPKNLPISENRSYSGHDAGADPSCHAHMEAILSF